MMRRPTSAREQPDSAASHEHADARWVQAALARYEAPLLRYAVRLLNDAERARDVVQDAFLKLWQADRASVDGHLAQWLFKVVRNGSLDVRRKESRMTVLQEVQFVACDEASLDRIPTQMDAAASCAVDLLNGLPEKQQEAIRLKFQGGLSYAEIANVMEVTVNHVGVLIHMGLKSIREKLGVEDGGALPRKSRA